MESSAAITRIVFRTGQLASLLAVLHRYAATFYQIGEILCGLLMIGATGDSKPLEPEQQRYVLENFQKIKTLSGRVGLTLSVKHAERVLSNHNTAMTHTQLKEAVAQLQDRIRDELDSVYFLHVPFEKAKVYYNPHPFGEAVTNKFPKAITDMHEASKSFAVARYTACVFHLMRVMEIGVQYLGKKLKIPDTHEKEWQAILNSVNGALRRMSNPTTRLTSRQKARRDRYAKAAAHLENVKNAWRNNVMHPKASYTSEEAEEVFQAVKTYMQDLATIL
jgi:HEPN domain-containing protein